MRDDGPIRPAETRDLPALGRLGASMVRMHHDFDPQRFMAPGPDVEESYAWFLGTQLAEPDMFVGVAEGAGEVVGYVYAGLEPQSWKEPRDAAGVLHDLVGDERARRSGYGARRADAAADWFDGRGAPA